MDGSPLLEVDDISIPQVEIAKGWYVDDLRTVEDCDEALNLLTESISSIDAQLMLNARGALERPVHWIAKTQTALMWRRRARELIIGKRAQFAQLDKRATAWIKRNHPDVWTEAREQCSNPVPTNPSVSAG